MSRSGTRRPGGRKGRAVPGSREAPTLPTEPVDIDTGSARVERDPDRPDLVTLYVNDVPSSALDLADPGFLSFEYMQQMASVLDVLPPGPLRVLHLGAAGCALPRYVAHERPGSRQLGVDVDARLLELVRTWFDLPRSPALRLRTDDAGHALAGLPPASYDVVVRDVFAGDRTPAHLTGEEFFVAAHRVLRPGGVLLANCADRPPLHLVRRELAALAGAFGADAARDGRLGAIAEHAILKGRRYGNVVLVALRGPDQDAPAADDSGATDAGATDGGATDGGDLKDPALARALRSLAVPAHLVSGAELVRFASLTPAGVRS
ncbi:fused MFS/spermidine synthase [Isoptericola sp. NEAU-Y5]|uniref:Fused MFS/spermidine synthase n=1 Tax=Isoptericola luteus TaxID=2879484 RepID=A0ABS7ZDP4_9MICO|nr:fused MFS/spermidine synthase [Isoptericola sp. NEAU-Y5]MCA5893162.1 fused MFS/spermidine synthase [Isoptericola sp. NEAU-Y5]